MLKNLDVRFAFRVHLRSQFYVQVYRYSILFLTLTFLATPLAHAGWSFRNNVELAPQYRKLHQERFTPLKEVWDLWGRADLHAEYSSEKLFLDVKPEIRAVASRGVLDPAPANVSSATTKRVLNARRTLIREDDGEAYFDFDRLNFRYTFAAGDIYAGRKPLSLGVLRFFPVWNKLTLPLIFQPGPEWIENPDVVGLTIQRDDGVSHRLFASRTGEAQKDDLVLLETRVNGEGYEAQFLGGYWWEHVSLGVAGALDVASSTLRLESLIIHKKSMTVPDDEIQFGLGFERALDEKWTLVTEALYQSRGLADTANAVTPATRFMALAGRSYVLPYLTYQVHPLWNLRFGGLAAIASRPSYVALFGFEHSVTDNTTLTLKVKWPFGNERGEFGSRRVSGPFGAFAGASDTALLQLQSTF